MRWREGVRQTKAAAVVGDNKPIKRMARIINLIETETGEWSSGLDGCEAIQAT